MINRIWAIARNTHREAVRQKVLYVLVLFAALLILFSLFLGQLTLGADAKMVKDMGLASITLFGALIAIFVGVGIVFKEVERRTIYTILSKPVSRTEFIVGKYFGLCMTIAIEIMVMTGLLFLVLLLYRGGLDFNLLKSIVLIYTELCILTAVTILFSTYSSSFMSTVFALAFWVVGHVTDDLASVVIRRVYSMLQEAETVVEVAVGNILLWLVKGLELFSLDHFAIHSKIVHGVPISWAWVVNAIFFGLCWIFLIMFVASMIFEKKDLQ